MTIRILLLGVLLAAAPASAADADGAAEIFAKQCALCHGPQGRGDGMAASMLQPRPTNFAAPGYWDKADRAALRKVIHDGKAGTGMTGFGSKLNDEQIGALLKYIETLGAH